MTSELDTNNMTMAIDTNLNDLLHDFRKGLQELYGDRLVHLILFGSCARQEATPDSDIDVMVVLKDAISPGDEIFRMSAIKTAVNLQYDEFISVIPISEEDYQTRHTPLLAMIHQEGIAI